MRLIAIETSTDACSAALYLDGEIRSRFESAPRRHAARILPMVDELLGEAGLALNGLDAVAFGRGPGAFTGLRIAAGVAQGLAFAAGLPVVPVSTLAALAQQLMPEQAKVIAALDARMGEVYWGVYERDDSGLAHLVGRESVVAPEQAPLPPGTGWFGAGSGWASYGELLAARLGAALAGRAQALRPRAQEVAVLGARDYARGLTVSAERAEPVYLRDRVAEVPR